VASRGLFQLALATPSLFASGFLKNLTLRYGRARRGVNPEILSFAGFPSGASRNEENLG
jgi:hypothetical protein